MLGQRSASMPSMESMPSVPFSGMESETLTFLGLPGTPLTPEQINTLDANIRSIKAGGSVTLSSLTLNMSTTATGLITGASADLRPYSSTVWGAIALKMDVTVGANTFTLTPGAAGTGEGLGGELYTNGSFSSDTTWWAGDIATGVATLASVAGGQSGNCLELTMVSGTRQCAVPAVPGNGNFKDKLLKLSGYVKSGTSGNEQYGWEQGVGGSWANQVIGVSSASWAPFSAYYLENNLLLGQYQGVSKNSATAGTMLFDELSMKQVTAPDSSGLVFTSGDGAAFIAANGANAATKTVTITKAP